MQIAREAIAMARRLGDGEALLDTLRNGGSSMVDLGDPEERIVIDREHAVLAEELGNPVEALRGHLRSIMDYLELGRLDDAFRAMRACERITEGLNHPAYRWRPIALRVLRATWEGDFDEAERLAEEVRVLGERGGDPNAAAVHAMQKTRLLQLRGDFDAQLPWLADLDRHWDDTEVSRTNARVIVNAEHIAAGRVALGIRGYDPDAGQRLLRMGDHTLQLSFVRVCVAAEDRELAEKLYRRLLVSEDHLVTGGIPYLTLDGPASWGLASLARFLGRIDEAREHYEHALGMSRRTAGRPVYALIACEYAALLAESDALGHRERAWTLAQEAGEIADELGMRAVKVDANALRSNLDAVGEHKLAPHAETDVFTMHQVGDAWLLRYGNVEFHLKNMRGVRLLAALVAEPGREFHVLDLSSGSRASTETADRARVNVQRRIRDAIRRIESHHPGLAKHLDRSVRTGTYCAYEPQP